MHAGEGGTGPAACHPGCPALIGHGRPGVPATRLDADAAATVAATLQALAAPSRLMILATLRRGPHAVSDIAALIGMAQSAVSHQLRLLRALGLVASRRAGRRIVYSLHDQHVAQLLDEAVYHSEHLRLGIQDGADVPGPLGDATTSPP